MTKAKHNFTIKTAVILAAGRGARLQEMTDFTPKCLVKVHGVSLLERMLSQLNANAIEKVILVVGYQAEKIIQKMGYTYENISITYVHNEYWETTNNVLSLYLAVDFLKEDFILLESDLILDAEALLPFNKPNLMAVEAFQSHMDGTVVDVEHTSNVRAMYLKSSLKRPKQLDEYFKTVNIYSFSAKDFLQYIVPLLKEILDEGKTNAYYELAFERAIDQKLITFKAIDFSRYNWTEIDNQEDWKRASTLFEATLLNSYNS